MLALQDIHVQKVVKLSMQLPAFVFYCRVDTLLAPAVAFVDVMLFICYMAYVFWTGRSYWLHQRSGVLFKVSPLHLI